MSELLRGYAKGAHGVFGQLQDKLDGAKADAARVLADAVVTGEFNPSTEVHELVDYLQSLKSDGAADGN